MDTIPGVKQARGYNGSLFWRGVRPTTKRKTRLAVSSRETIIAVKFVGRERAAFPSAGTTIEHPLACPHGISDCCHR